MDGCDGRHGRTSDPLTAGDGGGERIVGWLRALGRTPLPRRPADRGIAGHSVQKSHHRSSRSLAHSLITVPALIATAPSLILVCFLSRHQLASTVPARRIRKMHVLVGPELALGHAMAGAKKKKKTGLPIAEGREIRNWSVPMPMNSPCQNLRLGPTVGTCAAVLCWVSRFSTHLFGRWRVRQSRVGT
ncbi:hypothetical protein B0T24DRAFT_214877 [Lasiosphaeria ovina]|uniref:Uncharacterized protein n=1 Tax=Lasiosphaeria ovina TaxID=92902 RepID=A0AAE0KGZ8_9PEZI|nr:hypothetical protein B0T24DRAFT_214877 [Lasiosphaeria ovina]